MFAMNKLERYYVLDNLVLNDLLIFVSLCHDLLKDARKEPPHLIKPVIFYRTLAVSIDTTIVDWLIFPLMHKQFS